MVEWLDYALVDVMDEVKEIWLIGDSAHMLDELMVALKVYERVADWEIYRVEKSAESWVEMWDLRSVL